jgi:diacylglycerol kinase family enzyme
MQAYLIYNPNSGGNTNTEPESFVQALKAAGYDPVYQATSSEEDLDPILKEAQGLVVVAGGDGSVRAVATRLIGREIPIAILPLGTANNIGRTLGITGSPVDIITGLRDPRIFYFDVGQVRSPWGVDYFLEAFGYGLYADTLQAYEPEKGKSVLRSIQAITQTLKKFRPRHCRLVLDGQNISGNYLLVEVFNTPAMGPRLKLAPDADPGDGLFNVVRIDKAYQEGYLRFLTSMLAGELGELPHVEVNFGKRLKIAWKGFPFHVDAEVRPVREVWPAEATPARGARSTHPSAHQSIVVDVDLIPGAIEFWLPERGA